MTRTTTFILAACLSLAASTAIHAQPNFTKITTGPIATDAANTRAACWVDFDADGDSVDAQHAHDH